MRKTTFFAALLGLALFFGSLVPSADAQWRWRRAARWGRYYGGYPAYYGKYYGYGYPSSYGSYYYGGWPSYSYYGSYPSYGSYYMPYSSYSYPYYGSSYYGSYYYPSYYRGFVNTPWVSVGW